VNQIQMCDFVAKSIIKGGLYCSNGAEKETEIPRKLKLKQKKEGVGERKCLEKGSGMQVV